MIYSKHIRLFVLKEDKFEHDLYYIWSKFTGYYMILEELVKVGLLYVYFIARNVDWESDLQ